MPDVVVVGGGITGLAAAWFLREAEPGLAITLVESAPRLGGKIGTTQWLGVPVEVGPDTFLARVPGAVELCRALDLGDDLVAPAVSRALLWTRGRLRSFPEGHVLGVPARLGPVARSGVLSPAGLLRTSLDLVLPRRPLGPDPSVADVVAARFGREVVDRLVDPLLGGVHAGSTDRLSIASVAPAVAEAADRSRSLFLALRSAASPAARSDERTPRPVFLSVRGGLGRLVERLSERLDGVDVRLETQVKGLSRTGNGTWRVSCAGGPDMEASAVVLAVPAFAAAALLRTLSTEAAVELGSVRHASVVTVTFAYRGGAVPDLPAASGFLVPAVDRRLMTACTFLTQKWPDLSRSRRVLFRASAGRATDERAMELDDQTLATKLHGELAQAVGLRDEPEDFRVVRWERAFPQYECGHRDRIARIEQVLRVAAPGLTLAGAAYHGLGIAACVRDAEQAAVRTAKELVARS
jgi:oxygen-dependent protoporphyrinogen oxidase